MPLPPDGASITPCPWPPRAGAGVPLARGSPRSSLIRSRLPAVPGAPWTGWIHPFHSIRARIHRERAPSSRVATTRFGSMDGAERPCRALIRGRQGHAQPGAYARLMANPAEHVPERLVPCALHCASMRTAAACVLAVALGACSHPFLARDGTLVFQEKGAHGASVVTANGLEFHDVVDVPERVVVRDPYEPWRAPLGFLVPANGRFTKTSVPTLVATTGLAVSLRPSDTRVPSWGGEMLVRVDVLAPAAAGTARWGGDIAFVLDGRSDDLARSPTRRCSSSGVAIGSRWSIRRPAASSCRRCPRLTGRWCSPPSSTRSGRHPLRGPTGRRLWPRRSPG